MNEDMIIEKLDGMLIKKLKDIIKNNKKDRKNFIPTKVKLLIIGESAPFYFKKEKRTYIYDYTKLKNKKLNMFFRKIVTRKTKINKFGRRDGYKESLREMGNNGVVIEDLSECPIDFLPVDMKVEILTKDYIIERLNFLKEKHKPKNIIIFLPVQTFNKISEKEEIETEFKEYNLKIKQWDKIEHWSKLINQFKKRKKVSISPKEITLD